MELHFEYYSKLKLSGYSRTNFVSNWEVEEHYLYRDTLLFMVNITDLYHLNMTSGLDQCGKKLQKIKMFIKIRN